MITEPQLTEIRNYLLSKKLPIDILMEVEDHFISQINNEIDKGNMSFEEAFLKTKNSWADEFSWEIPFYIIANRADGAITKFESRVRRDAQWSTSKTALFTAVLIIVLLFFVTRMNGVQYHLLSIKIFLGVCYAFAFLPILYNLIINSAAYKKRYQMYKFSVYHDRIFLVFSFVYFMQMYLKPFDEWLPAFINFEFSQTIILKILGLIAIYFVLIYTGIWQIRFAKKMKKIKKFLKLA